MPRLCLLLPLALLGAAAAPLHSADELGLPQPSGRSATAALPDSSERIGLGGRTHWFPILTEAAKSPDIATRARAAFLIGQVAAGASQPYRDTGEHALISLLQDDERDVRIHAGIGLGHLGVEAATATCAAALADGPRWRRYYAAVALERIGTPRARKLLAAGAEGQSEYIRDAIEWFLLSPADRPEDPGRKAEYTPAPSTPPLPAGLSPDEIFALAADVLWGLSNEYWHVGEHEDCIRLGLTSTFLDASHVDAWGSVGWLTWSAGRNAEAVRIYAEGLDANPDRYNLYFDLGFHLYNIHRYRAALPYLQKASEFPSSMYAPRAYAHCLEKLGQLGKSLEVWTKLLEQDPKDAVVLRNHARVKRLVDASR
jgi:tetratricopeptide (TPR) repeat protein